MALPVALPVGPGADDFMLCFYHLPESAHPPAAGPRRRGEPPNHDHGGLVQSQPEAGRAGGPP